jgi:hypothetical protein
MENILIQVLFWGAVSVISFGIVSYLVFTCPEYEEMEDGTMIRIDE